MRGRKISAISYGRSISVSQKVNVGMEGKTKMVHMCLESKISMSGLIFGGKLACSGHMGKKLQGGRSRYVSLQYFPCMWPGSQAVN